MFKLSKKILGWTVLTTLVVGVLGFVTFGTSFGSYLRTSVGMMKTKVKDSIPIEVEIQRARDMLEDLVPEMRANMRIVATEEVEVANLADEIGEQEEAITNEREKLQNIHGVLKSKQEQVVFRFGDRSYERTELVTILSTQFERLTTAEKFLEVRRDLLGSRRASLAAAVKKLEQTRLAKEELKTKIESLHEQYRIMQLKSQSKNIKLDDSSLAKIEKLIDEVENRLEVEQNFMATEAKFMDMLPLETPDVNEESVLERVDAYFMKDGEIEGESSTGLKSATY